MLCLCQLLCAQVCTRAECQNLGLRVDHLRTKRPFGVSMRLDAVLSVAEPFDELAQLRLGRHQELVLSLVYVLWWSISLSRAHFVLMGT